MTEHAAIRCEQYLPHPPSAVWTALTDPELLARWWVPGDIKPIVGHRFTLDMGNWGLQSCEVTAADPERLLRYRFAEGSLDTTITWRLEPDGTGTRLLLEHAGFDLDSPMGKRAYEGMGEGWPYVVARIDEVLADPAA
ncbi:SRPBCC domain-containing protein [Streptomyces sp. NPDC001315]|uniref:SRPBCC family protein n=1 Tax=Streptomyces sp. NPDC001315 TaxID=3364562 RepID=UPI0036BB6A58